MQHRPSPSSDASFAASGKLANGNSLGHLIGRVLRMIHSAKLKPHDQLPSENELAREFAVARSSVREALKALEALGVVETAAGKRARVGRMHGGVMSLLVHHSVQTMQVSIPQTLDLRRTLEMRTARIAALCRSDEDLACLTALCDTLHTSADDLQVRMRADIDFHLTIARASGNPLYEMMIESFVLVMQKTIPVGWAARTTQAARMEVLTIHADIVSAIRQQDPVAAEQAMARHFDNTLQMLALAGIA